MTERKMFRGALFFLSNFYPCSITYKGRVYPTSENAYQSAKSRRKEWKEFCQKASPGECKRMAKTLKPKRWEELKVGIMLDILFIKFSSGHTKTLLLLTGKQMLIEWNTWGDSFWGKDIFNGRGENNLGKLLMEVRRRIKEHEKPNK